MPTYDILCIAKVTSKENFKRIFRNATSIVVRNGGLVRGVDNLGVRPLPYRMRAHTKWNYYGNYFKFKVQINPQTLKEVDKSFKIDEDMIRWTPIKEPRRQRVPEPFSAVQELKSDLEERTFLRKHLPLDYSIAVQLLEEGKVTEEELKALPTRKWKVPDYFKRQNMDHITEDTKRMHENR
eukprot:1317970-Amorphochlora_amoeboformis.AAC.1